MSKKKDGKITLGMLKGKPVTTSVPSISIKFHANAEQLEELYGSDEEHTGNDLSVGSSGVSEPESSPLKYLPRLVKRSTSIDITPQSTLDASPPSDPWRFFSDIKGKITKSVEEKITEIKSRNHEEGSPLKRIKDSKDNSSVSDSEELSESSISKTCGIVSTTEGAEMSSDEDDTPSIEKDKKTEDRAKLQTAPVGLRQRFRLLKPKSVKEGSVSRKSLKSLYSINSDKIEQALPEETDVESAVDALEESNLQEEVLKGLETEFDNIKLDCDNVVSIKEVAGEEVTWEGAKTVYAPVGFVDLRVRAAPPKNAKFFPLTVLIIFCCLYFMVHRYSTYLAGFLVGALITFFFYYVKNTLDSPSKGAPPPSHEILQFPAIKEFQPLTKYEGWVNEFPETYNPLTYHISQTQSVFLRLQGNLLRMSHTRSKVPKRALWNEPKIKPVFTHHRVYNLMGAQISLLPEGLAKKRHWSKKYPICVSLNKDQMDFEAPVIIKDEGKVKRGHLGRKKRSHTLRFSKLSEENEDFDLDSETSRASTPSPLSQDDSDKLEEEKKDEEDVFGEFEALPEDWGNLTLPEDDSPTSTKLYIFGRTDREKEDWFRRLAAAARATPSSESSPSTETDYVKYMVMFNKGKGDEAPPTDVHWLNSLTGRVLFDCLRDETFTQRVKDKIQRKLASIKLPYFIEGLLVTELSLGHNPPLIHKTSKPVIDERGLWIDLDVTYAGLIVLILQTKLNLMKLKQPPNTETNIEKSAMFNSDLEDSAESTSDEEAEFFQEEQIPTGGGTSKKFMKMVDKIAESKFFQAATEYRYIKKAMEGVSNTELRLRVEVKELEGTLVLNVPPPPSDRVWVGFRPVPTLGVSAQPIVGERNITYLRITSWIEKKLLLEFQKLMVIPNMEDFIVPVMCPKLPE